MLKTIPVRQSFFCLIPTLKWLCVVWPLNSTSRYFSKSTVSNNLPNNIFLFNLSLIYGRMKIPSSYLKQLATFLARESFLRFQLMLITSKERALSMSFDWLLMTVKWLMNLLLCLLNRYYTDYNCLDLIVTLA